MSVQRGEFALFVASLVSRHQHRPSSRLLQVHGTPSEFGELRVQLEVIFPKALAAQEREWLVNHFDYPI
eukprot:scaffold250554_cov33-Tisochrysis_lutea.AAC.2